MNTWVMDQFERGELDLAELKNLLWQSMLYLLVAIRRAMNLRKRTNGLFRRWLAK